MQFERDQSLLQLAESISYKWGRLWSWQSYKMTVIAQFEKNRSSPPEADLGKDVLKICSKFTGEHPCVTVNSIKLLCNVIEITLQHGCSPVNLLHIFRAPFPRNTSGGLLVEKWLKWDLQIYTNLKHPTIESRRDR